MKVERIWEKMDCMRRCGNERCLCRCGSQPKIVVMSRGSAADIPRLFTATAQPNYKSTSSLSPMTKSSSRTPPHRTAAYLKITIDDLTWAWPGSMIRFRNGRQETHRGSIQDILNQTIE